MRTTITLPQPSVGHHHHSSSPPNRSHHLFPPFLFFSEHNPLQQPLFPTYATKHTTCLHRIQPPSTTVFIPSSSPFHPTRTSVSQSLTPPSSHPSALFSPSSPNSAHQPPMIPPFPLSQLCRHSISLLCDISIPHPSISFTRNTNNTPLSPHTNPTLHFHLPNSPVLHISFNSPTITLLALQYQQNNTIIHFLQINSLQSNEHNSA